MFLSPEERALLNEANALAWGREHPEMPQTWLSRRSPRSHLRHDASAYERFYPIPGAMVNKVCSEIGHERFLTRLWNRKNISPK